MGLRAASLYDEASLSRTLDLQRREAWDLDASIPWSTPIDLSLPLVALDEDAFFFPGASAEERLVISQMMGLIIATSISEMEECLERLKAHCWERIHAEHPVNPEFVELGEQFFEEERKHSRSFRRYVDRFAAAANVSPAELLSVLPKIENTLTERFLTRYTKLGGHSFWWIVASAEHVFLQIYNGLAPHKERLEPLYFEIHRRHFEEEARHAYFPYLMLELLASRPAGPLAAIHRRADLVVAEFLQSLWTVRSLAKSKRVRDLAGRHPIFRTLASVYPKLDSMGAPRVLWKLFTETPYVTGLVNPNAHKRYLGQARKLGAYSAPFPTPKRPRFVAY